MPIARSCAIGVGMDENYETIIGVMGGGEGASPQTCMVAYELGAAIARQGWVLLCGGRAAGVMDAAAQGAAEAGGLTVGILPDTTAARASRFLAVPILTGMGDGRNIINVLSSQVVVALKGGAGTLSEIALALKSQRPVILLDFPVYELFSAVAPQGFLYQAEHVDKAIVLIQSLLSSLE